MIAIFVAAVLVAAGLLYEAGGEYLDARRYPPPGQLIG